MARKTTASTKKTEKKKDVKQPVAAEKEFIGDIDDDDYDDEIIIKKDKEKIEDFGEEEFGFTISYETTMEGGVTVFIESGEFRMDFVRFTKSAKEIFKDISFDHLIDLYWFDMLGKWCQYFTGTHDRYSSVPVCDSMSEFLAYVLREQNEHVYWNSIRSRS